jgi:hypothetical protein
MENGKNGLSGFMVLCGAAAFAFSLLVLVFMFGMPWYWIYHQHQEGRAMLAKAEYEKQILVQEAMSKMEAAKSLAAAEVTRAEGVAKANKIIGDSLKDNREYLHYLWIHNLEEGNNAVIYVPTEANLPILEAGRRPGAPARGTTDGR